MERPDSCPGVHTASPDLPTTSLPTTSLPTSSLPTTGVVPALLDRLTRALHALPSLLLPGRCLLCGAASRRAMDLCPDCEADLPWIITGCSICSLPMSSPGICGQCLTEPPLFDSCRSLFAFEEPVSSLIRRFKHHQGFVEGRILADLLASHLEQVLVAGNRPDLIVPVPAHWRRRWRRGFNQTELLCAQLSRRLKIPTRRALRALRHHPPQHSLGKRERRTNLRGHFAVRGGVEGLHIALVDDVVTTGATANELARLLRRHGAMVVDVWTLARTPSPEAQRQNTGDSGKLPPQPR